MNVVMASSKLLMNTGDIKLQKNRVATKKLVATLILLRI
jgi:hypothetical protein